MKLPPRKREDIKRSRGENKHFSEKRHEDLVFFIRSTGLRRVKLNRLIGKDVYRNAQGELIVHIHCGKGGKMRNVHIPEIYAERVEQIARRVGDKKRVFDTIPSKAPAHKYRADFAAALYLMIARDIRTLPETELYRCRADLAGVVYDRKAMLQVSRELGHNRIDVIAKNYLYGLKEEMESRIRNILL